VSRLPVLYACQDVQMCLDGLGGQEGGAENPFLQGQLQYHISKITIDLNKACTKPPGAVTRSLHCIWFVCIRVRACVRG
jgi:hypothetical protein